MTATRRRTRIGKALISPCPSTMGATAIGVSLVLIIEKPQLATDEVRYACRVRYQLAEPE